MSPALIAAILAAAGLGADLDARDAECVIVHYAADGTRSQSAPSKPYAGPRAPAASMTSTGEGGVSSSASARSSSSSGDEKSAVTRTERDGRAVTRTYDDNGCTVVIDDRPTSGARR